jgi:tRNA(Arg) A34 adenosine deaminase TadA
MGQRSEDFMRHAINLAIENVRTGAGGPFGAVVVKAGEVVATGVNLVTSTNDPTAHAEVVAIRAACRTLNSFQLHDCDVYTNCEPCPMCLGAIYWARPARFYYACSRDDAASIFFDDEFIYDEFMLSPNERSIPGIRLLREEGLAAFETWTASKRRILY